MTEKTKSATETWKGVDVDKYIDELRGRDDVDWEAYRRDVAKHCIAAYCTKDMNGVTMQDVENIAAIAVIFADALIKKLKKASP